LTILHYITLNADVKYKSQVCEYVLSHPQHSAEIDVPFIDVCTVQDCVSDLKSSHGVTSLTASVSSRVYVSETLPS